TPTGGHCGFSAAEHVAAFLALTAWAEQGTVPSVAGGEAPCSAVAAVVGGPCGIIHATPGGGASRGGARRQKGGPLHSLVCGSDPGDCPEGSTCSTDTQHGR